MGFPIVSSSKWLPRESSNQMDSSLVNWQFHVPLVCRTKFQHSWTVWFFHSFKTIFLLLQHFNFDYIYKGKAAYRIQKKIITFTLCTSLHYNCSQSIRSWCFKFIRQEIVFPIKSAHKLITAIGNAVPAVVNPQAFWTARFKFIAQKRSTRFWAEAPFARLVSLSLSWGEGGRAELLDNSSLKPSGRSNSWYGVLFWFRNIDQSKSKSISNVPAASYHLQARSCSF